MYMGFRVSTPSLGRMLSVLTVCQSGLLLHVHGFRRAEETETVTMTTTVSGSFNMVVTSVVVWAIQIYWFYLVCSVQQQYTVGLGRYRKH